MSALGKHDTGGVEVKYDEQEKERVRVEYAHAKKMLEHARESEAYAKRVIEELTNYMVHIRGAASQYIHLAQITKDRAGSRMIDIGDWPE